MSDEPISVEAEVVEAEVVEAEEDRGLSVSLSPASIEANFAALEARVDSMLAPYEGAAYDLSAPDGVRQAKRDRAYLNGVAKEIDERRKAVKREYMRPYDEFEARANAITRKVREASEGIKAQLDEAEEARRDAAYAHLAEHYEAFAGALAEAVPYERIHDPRWLNKTFGEKKAEAEVEERAGRVARDWEALREQAGMARYDVAERAFFATLDLGAALAEAREAQEADERIAGLREAVGEPQAAPEPERAAAPACDDGSEATPAAPAAVPTGATASPAPAPVAVPGGGYVPCVMVVTAASREQMRQIGRFCGSLSPRVTGRFVTGTLRQAYEKELGKELGGTTRGIHV